MKLPVMVIRGSLAVCAVIAVLFSAGYGANDRSPDSAAAPWVRPLPPEQPRVRHIRTVITPQDLGVKKGFFQKLWELIAGEDTADRIVAPHGVAADGEGKLYVADWGTGRIHYFNFDKKTYDVFNKTQLGPLRSPIGVALDGEGRVYVTDSMLRRVFVFSGTSNRRVIGDDAFLRPTGIAINKKDKVLYVVDTRGHRVDAFDLEGKKLFSFGSNGSQEGKFNYPTHITVDAAGDLYVMDSLNFRVQIFDRNGKFLSQFGGAGTGIHDLMKPKGIAVDSDGHIWVSDSFRNSVQIFDRKGRLLLIFGSLGIGPGQFNIPEGLFIDSKDQLIVADSHNYRVQMFQYLKSAVKD